MTALQMEPAGEWRAAIADEHLRRHYPATEFDDSSWEPISVPGHWRNTSAFATIDGPLLYRTRFENVPDETAMTAPGDQQAPIYGDDEPPTGDPRLWLVLDGIMYSSDVWFDGTYIGDTEGYFFPHSFEISELVRQRHEHVLAMEVACTPPQDRAHKRNLTGIFQHWDMTDQTWNPGGLWCAPRIERSGSIRIKHFRVVCREADDSGAVIALRAVLDVAEAGMVTFETRLARRPETHASRSGDGATEPSVHREQRPLAAGENRVEWTVTEPDPALWWPWSLGDQPLYDLTCDVRLADGSLSDRQHRRLGLRSVTDHNFIFTINGQRLFLKGANHGPTQLALADASPAAVRNDVQLAKDANLDFMRLHAHIARPELYEAADEAGMLLWQDLPVQWGYARSVRRQARRQAREAIDLLAHHPSVFAWCGHNEPLALDVSTDAMADPHRRRKLKRTAAALMMLPTWNKTVLDRSVKRVLERCDGTRPVVAHSGVLPHLPQLEGTDTHLYFGWYHGTFRQFPRLLAVWPRVARFVSEFGAQAAPTDAPYLHPERWPDLDWTEARQRHSLQRTFFDAVVPPADFDSYDCWARATQHYQAELLRCHIESLRRIKYRPSGGFALFCLADCQPAVSWSVLDHRRRPKIGYDAVRRACSPLAVIADWLPESLRPGQEVALDIHVVNDERTDLCDLTAKARLYWGSPVHRTNGDLPMGRRTDRSEDQDLPPVEGDHQWCFIGDAPADSVSRVGTICFVAPSHPALLTLDLELHRQDHPVRNSYTTRVL